MTIQFLACLCAYLYMVGGIGVYEEAMSAYAHEGDIETEDDLELSRRSAVAIALLWPITPIIGLIYSIIRLFMVR